MLLQKKSIPLYPFSVLFFSPIFSLLPSLLPLTPFSLLSHSLVLSPPLLFRRCSVVRLLKRYGTCKSFQGLPHSGKPGKVMEFRRS
jgi:hypothetical protein